jgi:hypothetical protein
MLKTMSFFIVVSKHISEWSITVKNYHSLMKRNESLNQQVPHVVCYPWLGEI